jgi:hypothetical protein
MEKKKAYSYLEAIGSGKDAQNVDSEQVGLGHEQEVTEEKNWGSDKRDAVGRAASIENKKKRLAKKLMRISRELEALGKMEDGYKGDVEKMEEDPMAMEMGSDEESNPNEVEPDNDEDDNIDEDSAEDEKWVDPTVDTKVASVKKEAEHPIKHDPNADDPEAFKSSQMGDEEWISIGPGTFDDHRDQVGKASK